MYNRYKNNTLLDNNSPLYKQALKEKNIKRLVQYETFNFKRLKDINSSNLEYVLHQVEPFERLYMISQKYYNSPEYGWIICYTNNISSELSINTGDLIKVYVPLLNVLEFIE